MSDPVLTCTCGNDSLVVGVTIPVHVTVEPSGMTLVIHGPGEQPNYQGYLSAWCVQCRATTRSDGNDGLGTALERVDQALRHLSAIVPMPAGTA